MHHISKVFHLFSINELLIFMNYWIHIQIYTHKTYLHTHKTPKLPPTDQTPIHLYIHKTPKLPYTHQTHIYTSNTYTHIHPHNTYTPTKHPYSYRTPKHPLTPNSPIHSSNTHTPSNNSKQSYACSPKSECKQTLATPLYDV